MSGVWKRSTVEMVGHPRTKGRATGENKPRPKPPRHTSTLPACYGKANKVDARSDVFGLGGILAVILTGAPPFAASSAETTRIRAAQGKVGECFARLAQCGAEPDLITLCQRCLAPDPGDRPADAGAVAGLRAAADERARRAELDRVK